MLSRMAFILLAFMCGVAQAQDELEEPAAPAVSYRAEVAWGAKAQLTEASWSPIALEVIGVEHRKPLAHSYRCETLGTSVCEFESPSSTDTTPETVRIRVDIADIGGSSGFWGFYRLRIWPVINAGEAN